MRVRVISFLFSPWVKLANIATILSLNRDRCKQKITDDDADIVAISNNLRDARDVEIEESLTFRRRDQEG